MVNLTARVILRVDFDVAREVAVLHMSHENFLALTPRQQWQVAIAFNELSKKLDADMAKCMEARLQAELAAKRSFRLQPRGAGVHTPMPHLITDGDTGEQQVLGRRALAWLQHINRPGRVPLTYAQAIARANEWWRPTNWYFKWKGL